MVNSSNGPHNGTLALMAYKTGGLHQRLADLKEEVYIEPPCGFSSHLGKDMVLHLFRSLYSLEQAPKTLFDKLRVGLQERGFYQSSLDPCLFMKKNMVCLVYIDDTILAGPDKTAIENKIRGLGVSTDEQVHKFGLHDEGEVRDFLGIRKEKLGTDKFHLTQTRLITKFLETTSMANCNTAPTPALITPLGIDSFREQFRESWNYATVIGMLMYLSSNSCPEIAFAFHQCTRITHTPQQLHTKTSNRSFDISKVQKTKESF